MIEQCNIDIRFSNLLIKINKNKCPNCGKEIDRGDVAWNCACTEAGTECSILSIICQKCSTEIIYEDSWNPGIENFEEFVLELEDILLEK